MKNLDDYLAGGAITPEGRAAGITDDDVAGGQLIPAARARLEAEAKKAEAKKAKSK